MKMTLSGSSYTERPLSVVPSSLWQWSLVWLFKTHSHSKDGTQEHSGLEEPGIHSFKSEGENTGVEELQGGRTVKLSSRGRCLRASREADCWPWTRGRGSPIRALVFQWEGAMNRTGKRQGPWRSSNSLIFKPALQEPEEMLLPYSTSLWQFPYGQSRRWHTDKGR